MDRISTLVSLVSFVSFASFVSFVSFASFVFQDLPQAANTRTCRGRTNTRSPAASAR